MTRSPRRITRPRRWVLAAAGLLAIVLITALMAALAVSTTTIQVGVDYQVSARTLPVYVKVVDFVQRHNHYTLLAGEITRGLSSDTARALAVFEWTRRNIRPTPEGLPLMDDHILNIIIRGHGLGDQMADVFATLLTYAGVPAFWTPVKDRPSHTGVILSFALIDGRWVPFDVENGLVFRSSAGALAGVDELLRAPESVASAIDHLESTDVPYITYLRLAADAPARIPRPLRSELQNPWIRVRHEIGNLLGRRRSDNAADELSGGFPEIEP